MLPTTGLSRLGRVLPRHLGLPPSRSMSRLREAGLSDLAESSTPSPAAARPQPRTQSSLPARPPRKRIPKDAIPSLLREAGAPPPAAAPSPENNARPQVPNPTNDPASNIRSTLRSGKGTTLALQKAHKYLYHARRKSDWKDLYAAEHPEGDMDANWKTADKSDKAEPASVPFTPLMVTRAEATHPYILAYEELVTAFLDHPYGAASAKSLLKRQLAEGVPLTTASSLAVLEHMPLPLNLIGALLPSPTPPQVLAATIRSAVRQNILETPATFRQIITDTLAEGGQPTEPERWDWSIWAAFIAAHVGNLRGAVRALGEFKGIVGAARKEAVDSGAKWPDKRANAIGDAYANVMHLWVDNKVSRRRSASGSNLPALMAADLLSLLEPGPSTPNSTDEPASPSRSFPLQFSTAWLNAERFNKTNRGDLIWSSMSGQSIDRTVAGDPPPMPLDTPAYLALFKLLKLNPPTSYRPLALNTPITARSGLLSAVAVHSTPDMPLVLALVSSSGPPARASFDVLFRERRFDIAASAIVRAARQFVAQKSKHLLPAPYPPFPFQASDGRRSIAPGEWDWISDCIKLHSNSITPCLLPLSSPIASLQPAKSGDPRTTRDNPIVVTHDQTYKPDFGRPNEAERLLPALKRVLRDAIVSEARFRDVKGDYATVLAVCMDPLRPLLGDGRVIERNE